MNSQLELDSLIKPFADLAFIIDREYRYRFYWTSNPALLFVQPEDFLKKTISEVLGDEFAAIFIPIIDKVFLDNKVEEIEYNSPDGSKWFKAIISPYDNGKEQREFISIYSKDITEEKDTHSKKRLFENIITNNWDAVIFADLNGKVEYVNPAAKNLYGFYEEELIGKRIHDFNTNVSEFNSLIKNVFNYGYWTGEIEQKRKDNSTFNAFLSIQVIKDEKRNPIGYVSFSKDISNEQETAQKLKEVIVEKDELLQELHHRVKNNLSIIKGLLKLKMDEIRDPSDTVIISDYLNRIDALAMITNRLYVRDKLNESGFREFINDIKYNIISFYKVNRPVRFFVETTHFMLPFSKVIPFGLIVNEVITNSIKHAFLNIEQPKIKIELKREADLLILTIEDNGNGFDYSDKKDSFGLGLIDALVDQIDGEFEFNSNNGSCFKLKLYEKDLYEVKHLE